MHLPSSGDGFLDPLSLPSLFLNIIDSNRACLNVCFSTCAVVSLGCQDPQLFPFSAPMCHIWCVNSCVPFFFLETISPCVVLFYFARPCQSEHLRFWNHLADANSIFVVAAIIFFLFGVFKVQSRSCACAVACLHPRNSIPYSQLQEFPFSGNVSLTRPVGGAQAISLKRCIAHACAEFTIFVIPGETICDGSQGMERRLNTGRMVRGHPWPLTAVSPVAKGTGQGQGQDSRGASSASCARGALASRCPSTRLRDGARRNPDEVRLATSNKITRLQSALAVLGDERSALDKKAQVQAVIPPVAERIEQTQKFIERAR